jgi:two-component system chemotaxis response regulator CheB
MTQMPQAVVVGVSAGALDALSNILPSLPHDYPLPVIIVVHLPPHKNSVLAELLGAKCKIKVREAEDKEPIRPGTAYIAPPDYHLLVEQEKILSLSNEEEILFSRPSIDVLFETAADAYGEGLIGVILTGANDDGAKGLKAVIRAGGVGIVQKPDEAAAFTMPQAALEASPSAQALSLHDISLYLIRAPYMQSYDVI